MPEKFYPTPKLKELNDHLGSHCSDDSYSFDIGPGESIDAQDFCDCQPDERAARYGSDLMVLACHNCGLQKATTQSHHRRLNGSRRVLVVDSPKSKVPSHNSQEVPEHRIHHLFALTNNYISESEGCILARC